MKRPHRRAHLLLWLLLAPTTAAASLWLWTLRPPSAIAPLPSEVEPLATDREAD